VRIYFKYFIYLYVLFGFSSSFCGSYEDYFSAIQRDDAGTVKVLLQRGFDPNTIDPEGRHGLLLALRVPALKVVDILLGDPKTTVEVRSDRDESPLMLAALKGLTDVCEKLIAKDADINKPGWTPLHYAATGGHVAVIRLLLENHAYIDASSPNGSTPLMMAAMYGSASEVKLLLESGADSALKNDLGLTAIDFALRVQHQDSVDILAAFIRANRPKGAW
jgi:ankyrin repeat protein